MISTVKRKTRPESAPAAAATIIATGVIRGGNMLSRYSNLMLADCAEREVHNRG
jgi:hypothetical protein